MTTKARRRSTAPHPSVGRAEPRALDPLVLASRAARLRRLSIAAVASAVGSLIGLPAAAWLLGLGWFAILIAISADVVRIVRPVTPYLLASGWLPCLVLDVVGTYRLTTFIPNALLRILATGVFVLLQCVLFALAVVALLPFWFRLYFACGGSL